MQVKLNDHTTPTEVKTSTLELTIPMSFKLAYLWNKFLSRVWTSEHYFDIAVEYGFKVLRKTYPLGKYNIYYSLNDNSLSFDIC